MRAHSASGPRFGGRSSNAAGGLPTPASADASSSSSSSSLARLRAERARCLKGLCSPSGSCAPQPLPRLPRLGFGELLVRGHFQGLVLKRLDDSVRGLDLAGFREEVSAEIAAVGPAEVGPAEEALGRAAALRGAMRAVAEAVPATRTLLQALLLEFEKVCALLGGGQERGYTRENVTAAMASLARDLAESRAAAAAAEARMREAEDEVRTLRAEKEALQQAKAIQDVCLRERAALLRQCRAAVRPPSSSGAERRTAAEASATADTGYAEQQELGDVAQAVHDEVLACRVLCAQQAKALAALRREDRACAEECAELRGALERSHEEALAAKEEARRCHKLALTAQHEVERQRVVNPFFRIQELEWRLRVVHGDVQHAQAALAQRALLVAHTVHALPVSPALRAKTPIPHVCHTFAGVGRGLWAHRVERCRKKDRFACFGDRLPGGGPPVPAFLRGKGVASARYRPLSVQETRAFVREVVAGRAAAVAAAGEPCSPTSAAGDSTAASGGGGGGGGFAFDQYFDEFIRGRFNIREQMLEWSYSVLHACAKHGADDADLAVFSRVAERTLPHTFFDHVAAALAAARTAVSAAATSAAADGKPPARVSLATAAAALERAFPAKSPERLQLLVLALAADGHADAAAAAAAAAATASGGGGTELQVEREGLVSEGRVFGQEVRRQAVQEHDDAYAQVRRTLLGLAGREPHEQAECPVDRLCEAAAPYVADGAEGRAALDAAVAAAVDAERRRRAEAVAAAERKRKKGQRRQSRAVESTAAAAAAAPQQEQSGWFVDSVGGGEGGAELAVLPLGELLLLLRSSTPLTCPAGFKLDLPALAASMAELQGTAE